MISSFKDNTNTHAYDGLVDYITNEMKAAFGGERVVGANPGEYVMGTSEFNTSAPPQQAPFSDEEIIARLPQAANEETPVDHNHPMPGSYGPDIYFYIS